MIIAEILDLAKDGALKTQIMYKGNLSFAQLNTYLNFLLDIELLGIVRAKGKRLYKTTEKGSQFMQSYMTAIEMISDNSNNNNPQIKGGPSIYWVKKTDR